MKIKHVVLISLIITLGTILILLIIGIFAPDSTLNKVSSWFGGSSSNIVSDSPDTAPAATTGETIPEAANTENNSGQTTTPSAPSATPTAPTTPTTPTKPTTPTVPVAPKCGGLTPCYGPSTMASHSSASSCWSYQTAGGTSVVYNMTSFNSAHSDGPKPEILAGCGGAISWSGVPSNGKHNASKSNSQSTFLQFKVGYYDASA